MDSFEFHVTTKAKIVCFEGILYPQCLFSFVIARNYQYWNKGCCLQLTDWKNSSAHVVLFRGIRHPRFVAGDGWHEADSVEGLKHCKSTPQLVSQQFLVPISSVCSYIFGLVLSLSTKQWITAQNLLSVYLHVQKVSLWNNSAQGTDATQQKDCLAHRNRSELGVGGKEVTLWGWI